MVRRAPKARRSQQDAPRGCLLNQLLLNQNQSPKKPPLRRQPRERRAATLLKMEMPRQTRHRRLTLLAMPNEKLMSVWSFYVLGDCTVWNNYFLPSFILRITFIVDLLTCFWCTDWFDRSYYVSFISICIPFFLIKPSVSCRKVCTRWIGWRSARILS